MKKVSSKATLLFVVVAVIGFGLALAINGEITSPDSRTIETIFCKR